MKRKEKQFEKKTKYVTNKNYMKEVIKFRGTYITYVIIGTLWLNIVLSSTYQTHYHWLSFLVLLCSLIFTLFFAKVPEEKTTVEYWIEVKQK